MCCEVYTPRVKLQVLILALVTGVLSFGSLAHSAETGLVHSTVCEIVNQPTSFVGKTVEIRAQIWPDDRNPNFFWMNEVSLQLEKVCRFLPATSVPLAGQTAFATFRGTIVRKMSRQQSTLVGPPPRGLGIIFVVDAISDIHLERKHPNDPIPLLQLYDGERGTFVRPEQ